MHDFEKNKFAVGQIDRKTAAEIVDLWYGSLAEEKWKLFLAKYKRDEISGLDLCDADGRRLYQIGCVRNYWIFTEWGHRQYGWNLEDALNRMRVKIIERN